MEMTGSWKSVEKPKTPFPTSLPQSPVKSQTIHSKIYPSQQSIRQIKKYYRPMTFSTLPPGILIPVMEIWKIDFPHYYNLQIHFHDI